MKRRPGKSNGRAAKSEPPRAIELRRLDPALFDKYRKLQVDSERARARLVGFVEALANAIPDLKEASYEFDFAEAEFRRAEPGRRPRVIDLTGVDLEKLTAEARAAAAAAGEGAGEGGADAGGDRRPAGEL